MRVLVVEDDAAIAKLVELALINHQYQVDTAMDGQAGWEMAEAFDYDLILLDLMLPYLDGIGFCQQLRTEGSSPNRSRNRQTPVLLITTQSDDAAKVTALDAGADDYLVKPFNLDELLARVRALLRRGRIVRAPLLQWGTVQMDPSTCEVTIAGQSVHLSAKEYTLLELFLRTPKRIFSHSYLIEQVWALEEIPTENAVRAQIKGLRKKLKEAGEPEMIETIYGLGYRLQADPGSQQPEVGQDLTAPKVERTSEATIPIQALFEKHRSGYYQRFQVIEQAVVALRQQQCSDDLRQAACREAHTLKGSLGLFEMDAASQLAHQIEQILKGPAIADQVEQLESQVTALQQFLVAEPSSSLEVPPQTPLITPADETAQTAKILIVDDDPGVLEMLQPILQPWGFVLTLLHHPNQWQHTLEQVRPDLVILDIEMPELSGIEICQSIRQDEVWGELPILFLSAHNDDATLQTIFTVGADDYVSKPVRAVELVARVLRRLEQARWLQQLRDRRLSWRP